MKYNFNEIEYVEAVKMSGFKTDIQVQVIIKLKKAINSENIQVKLVSNPKGFNQIDKRWVDKYVKMWNIPPEIVCLLKKYTGEILPSIAKPKDKRRMFANEFDEQEQQILLNWLRENKFLIISDILRGSGRFAAEWMLVAQKVEQNARWTLKSMNFCINFFSKGEILITKRGNIKIGLITMQRKGGDGGRKTAQMLQFKINPALLFDLK